MAQALQPSCLDSTQAPLFINSVTLNKSIDLVVSTFPSL